MKLRNKETGEHGDYQVISAGYLIRVRNCDTNESYQYDCLAGFNDKWEDYKPVEPLIKDEKIRKAVRAWAEANEVEEVDYWNSDYRFQDAQGYSSIGFDNKPIEEEDRYGNDVYTIAELCGEEKE